METTTRAAEIIGRLFRDRPLFHSLEEGGSQWLAEQGVQMPAGDFSLAVSAAVLEEIASHITSETLSLETGAGYTTVLLASLARHHFCHTFAALEETRIRSYLSEHGEDEPRVTFAIGASDLTLSRLELPELLDFAFVDGCHGYPYPAMDWHHVDKWLRVGGVLGMDNAELRPVAEHCRFLEENGSYVRVSEIAADCGYIARFYRKVHDEHREWNLQPYSRVKVDHRMM